MNEFSKVIDPLTPVVCSNVLRSMVLLWLDSDIYLALAKSVFKFLAFIYSTHRDTEHSLVGFLFIFLNFFIHNSFFIRNKKQELNVKFLLYSIFLN